MTEELGNWGHELAATCRAGWRLSAAWIALASMETGDVLVPCTLAALGTGVEPKFLGGNRQPAERQRRECRGVFGISRKPLL